MGFFGLGWLTTCSLAGNSLCHASIRVSGTERDKGIITLHLPVGKINCLNECFGKFSPPRTLWPKNIICWQWMEVNYATTPKTMQHYFFMVSVGK